MLALLGYLLNGVLVDSDNQGVGYLEPSSFENLFVVVSQQMLVVHNSALDRVVGAVGVHARPQ